MDDARSWLARNPPPDLQKWIAKHGGYWNIPWDEYDKEVAAWRYRLRHRHEERETETKRKETRK